MAAAQRRCRLPAGAASVAGVMGVVICGCVARTVPTIRFAGQIQSSRSLEQLSQPPVSWTVRIEGVTALSRRGVTVAMKISNLGRTPIRLSAVADRYFAALADGSAIELDEDFLDYPDQVAVGSEERVALLLPKQLQPGQIREIRGTIDDGRLQMVLRPESIGAQGAQASAPRREQRSIQEASETAAR